LETWTLQILKLIRQMATLSRILTGWVLG